MLYKILTTITLTTALSAGLLAQEPTPFPTAVREVTRSLRSPELALKHYSQIGGTAVLLIHGLGQNDRAWDAGIREFSFAQFLYQQGYDVWIGNFRGSGTEGFQSAAPQGPRHWNVEDYVTQDLPALMEKVEQATGTTPLLVAHSMGAWAIDGYLAGLKAVNDSESPSKYVWDTRLSKERQARVRGVVTIAGVYNVWWAKSIDRAVEDPILSADDYYASNYELELLSRVGFLYDWIPRLNFIPLAWIGKALSLPLDRLPWVGPASRRLYEKFQESVIETPLLNMLFYPANVDPDVIRLHGNDGLEDLSPPLVEQLANGIHDHELTTYYHRERGGESLSYAKAHREVRVPLFFVAGGKDRLAAAAMIYEDGYRASRSPDKRFLLDPNGGHIDVLNGREARIRVWEPVAKWLAQHSAPR